MVLPTGNPTAFRFAGSPWGGQGTALPAGTVWGWWDGDRHRPARPVMPAYGRRAAVACAVGHGGPGNGGDSAPHRRLVWFVWLLLGLGWLGMTAGCRENPFRNPFRTQVPDPVEKVEDDIEKVPMVGDLARPWGLDPIVVEGVALVTKLNGTGSDVPPSPQRDMLLADMRKRGVKNPNQVLASRDTTVVLVRGFIKPGAQEGDRFDVEVRVPSGTETTSLRGGFMLETRLRDFAVLGGMMREGHVLAVAEGPIMVDPEGGDDKLALLRGRVLGGARNLKSRTLALVLKQEHQSITRSAQVGKAVQGRFQTYDAGIRKGVADAKTDELIELKVHPRYRYNIPRYLQVVKMIPLREAPTKRMQRMAILERKLQEPITSARAALQLEAIGTEAIPTLKKGLKAEALEARFYAAEALAYMGERDCADVLAEAAKKEPALRIFALTALGSLDEVTSYDALRELIETNSAETRYGAFRALWRMEPEDPFIRGEILNGGISYHVIDSLTSPMVHATRAFRAEVVLFGRDQKLTTPCVLDAGPRIVVHSKGGAKVMVHKLALNEPEEQRETTDRLDDVIRAVADVGGNYPDIVQLLTHAKSEGLLEGRFELDALPEAGRTIERSGGRNDPWSDAPPKKHAGDDPAEEVPSGKSAAAKSYDDESLDAADFDETGPGMDSDDPTDPFPKSKSKKSRSALDEEDPVPSDLSADDADEAEASTAAKTPGKPKNKNTLSGFLDRMNPWSTPK